MHQLDDYLAADTEDAVSDRVALEEKLRKWVNQLVNNDAYGRIVLFTWARLRQEIMPEYRKGAANLTLHRTLNEMGIGVAVNWTEVFREVSFHSAHKEGIAFTKFSHSPEVLNFLIPGKYQNLMALLGDNWKFLAASRELVSYLDRSWYHTFYVVGETEKRGGKA
jgi:hypothetical protein